MEFTVKFISESRNSEIHHAINAIPMDIGIRGVNQIREELNLKSFPLDRVSSMTKPYLQKDPSIVVEEEIARESELFETKNTIHVSVPPNALNEYVYIKTESSKDSTGDIKNAYLKYHVYYNRILGEWREAGYPLKWLFKEEDI